MTQAEVRKMFIKANPGIKLPGKKGLWYRCAHCGKWCGRSGRDNVNIPQEIRMEVDHIIPWSYGGSDALSNLQPLCMPCNRSKSANPTLGDKVRSMGNVIMHPVDTLVKTPIRKAVRQNTVLKTLGIGTRK